MAVGDNYREISPHDRLIIDSAGNVAGIQSPLGNGGEMRGLTAAAAAAMLPVYIGAYGGSGMPTAAAAGAGARIQIVGLAYATQRLWFFSDGAYWKPEGRCTVARKTTLTSGAIQTADQMIGQLGPLPAGLFDGQIFALRMEFGRDVNTDTYGTLSHRLGAAGTTADAALSGVSYSGVFPPASGGVSAGLEAWYRATSTTTIARMGKSNGSASWAGADSTSVALQTSVTVPDLSSTALYVTATTTMGAAAATKPQTGYMSVELIA